MLQATQILVQQAPAPDYLSLAALNQRWEWYFTGEKHFAEQAIAYQLQALEQRPASIQGWDLMLEYGQVLPDGEAYREQAEQRLAQLQKHPLAGGSQPR